MRATVFPFTASHAVAETMKRSAIQRLEQPELLPIRSNTPDLVVRLSTNLDGTTTLTKKRPEASHRRALLTSTPRLGRTAFLQSVSYPRHSRAESFAQQIQLSMKDAAIKAVPRISRAR